MDEHQTFDFENDYVDPKAYNPYRGLSVYSDSSSEVTRIDLSKSDYLKKQSSIEKTEEVFRDICRRSGLNEEVSTKISKVLKIATISSMIAGSTSLVFLASFLGISGFSVLAVKRIEELKKRELNANPRRKVSIEKKYQKVLNQSYRS